VALAGRRSGHVLMLLGGLLGSVVPLAHMRGAGLVGGRIVGSGGIFFWVWTLVALGVTATVSVVLSARGLWSLRQAQLRRTGGGAPAANSLTSTTPATNPPM